MTETTLCNVCDNPKGIADTDDVIRVRSNVRRFRGETFTVWRCQNCFSLHAMEPVDWAHIYDNYPLQNQKNNFFTHVFFAHRLKMLRQGGLTAHDRILDYGCGSGDFVRLLRKAGYQAMGYDPFVPEYSGHEALSNRFDAVIAQDVLEHSPDPAQTLRFWTTLLAPNGLLFIGTPDAEKINLRSADEHMFEIHQPYHRHILSKQALRHPVKQYKNVTLAQVIEQ